jgi:hypothetical protein
MAPGISKSSRGFFCGKHPRRPGFSSPPCPSEASPHPVQLKGSCPSTHPPTQPPPPQSPSSSTRLTRTSWCFTSSNSPPRLKPLFQAQPPSPSSPPQTLPGEDHTQSKTRQPPLPKQGSPQTTGRGKEALKKNYTWPTNSPGRDDSHQATL